MSGKFIVFNGKKLLRGLLMVSLLTVICIVGSNMTKNIIETASKNRLLPVYSVETEDKKVAITFDCAWGADDIPNIVETLNTNNVNATFFAVGTWVDKYPEAIKLLADNNMIIGNHSNSHAHVSNMSYGEVLEDMMKCNEKIEDIACESVQFYRGPYGEYNNTVITVASELQMQCVQWNIDTLDYTGLTPDEMCARIKKGLKEGSIILMHNDTKYTALRFTTNY